MTAPAGAPRLRIGLAGLGTVGGAVARQLGRAVPEGDLVLVLVRDPARHRPAASPAGGAGAGDGPVTLTADPTALLDAGCDVVVECTGDVALGLQLAEATLARGGAFVTAGKQLLAEHGARLTALAARHRAHLAYEAAVGGAMPVVGCLRSGLRADRPQRLLAVLNGTTTFILDRMATGEPMAAALAAARAAGLAEADASADLDGHDPAAKLVVLAALLWGGWARLGDVARQGIGRLTPADSAIARDLDRAIRLVAQAEVLGDPGAPPTLTLAVEPMLVPLAHPLATARGAGNAVVLDSDLAGRTVLAGTGAGGRPTSSAVLSDLVRVAADRGRGSVPEPGPTGPPPRVVAADAPRAAAWRIVAADGPAAVAAALLGAGLTVEHAASLPPGAGGGGEAVVVVTAPAPASRRRAAAAALERGPGGYAVQTCLPLLEA